MARLQEFSQWNGGQEKARAPKTVHNQIAQLRAWLRAAVDAGRLEQSPVRKWLMPRIARREVEALTRAEVLALVEAVKVHQPDYYAPIALAAHTGLRIADVIDLRQGQVLPDRILRAQNKTQNAVTIPITESIRVALDSAKSEGPRPMARAMVHPRLLEPYRKNSVLRAIQRAAVKGGLDFRPTVKILRASWATYLAESGCSPKVRAELLGHTEVKMTLKYYVQAGFDRARAFLDGLEPTTENLGPTGHRPRKSTRING
jgi:integrase